MSQKTTTPDEVNQFVLDFTTKIYNELAQKIRELPIEQQFLVKSRIVSLIYYTHFNESLEIMDQKMKKARE
jgi:hypothetical protein